MPKIKVQYQPKKRFGQNFLIDPNISDKIINSCRLTDNEIVVEIGPGLGVITEEISSRVKKLIAIEIDKDLCEIIKPALSGRKNVEVICADFLKFDFNSFNQRVRIIGNLPFYITSPIISYIIDNRQFVNSAFITIQKEVADRIIASPGNKEYGSFSCFVQFYTKPIVLFDIKRTCFWPRPEVGASFLELKVLSNPSVKVRDEEFLFKIIRSAFNQRRKNILNSLKPVIGKIDLSRLLAELKISVNSRAEDLSLTEFASISDNILAINL